MTEQIHKGLAGVVVDNTAVSKVMPESNSLTYRGYPVQQLAALRRFEEVAYLIWNGELPDEGQLADFVARERAQREVPASIIRIVDDLANTAHPMDVLRTAISAFGANDPDADLNDPDSVQRKSEAMYAMLPAVVAQDMRRRRKLPRIAPDASLGLSENFFHMCFGEVPDPVVVDCFDTSMTLYAEHSFNASTFAARVVTSTLSDIYSSVTAAIGALKGPLHGGANEAVMKYMLEIDDPSVAADWLQARLDAKDRVMGFGHRVYRSGDSRVPTMKEAFLRMAGVANGQKWVEMYEILEEKMIRDKGIYPNLDFPAGPSYYLMGFDIPMFTPLFVMSRITGWTAHIKEQLASNALIRPLSAYTGPVERSVPDRPS